MNLEKEFNKIKNKKSGVVLATLFSVAITFVLLFLLNLLWNYVSTIWGLPKLTYLEFLATLFLLQMFMQFFSLTATNGRANPNVDILSILGEPPYDKY